VIDVFISYSRPERGSAVRIAQKLRTLGLEVWFDERIPSGANFDRELESALDQTRAVLVLWSPRSVHSDWVRNEALFGKERGKLVSLMIEPCELPIAFRSTQFEPLFDKTFEDRDPSWIKTIERLKDLAGKRAEIDVAQKKLRVKRRFGRALFWSLMWPVGALVALFVVSLLLEANRPVTPRTGGFAFTFWDRGYVVVSGTWEVEGEALAAKLNHVEITCDRSLGTCLEARAEVFQGLNNLLAVTTNTRPIETWTTDAIVTRDGTHCADYVMTISRQTESVTALQVRHPTTTRSDCSLLNERNRYRLVDGGDRSLNEVIARGRVGGNVFWSVLIVWTLFVAYRVLSAVRSRSA
jgi:hypothetical protein